MPGAPGGAARSPGPGHALCLLGDGHALRRAGDAVFRLLGGYVTGASTPR